MSNLSRRDILKLAAVSLGGLLAASCGLNEAAKSVDSYSKEREEANEILNELYALSMVGDNEDAILPTNSEQLLPETSSAMLTGLGGPMIVTTETFKATAGTMSNLKEARVDQGLADILTQVFFDGTPESCDRLVNTGTKYFHQGNNVDFVVHVPEDISGKPAYWYKFVRSPKQVGDIQGFDKTLEMWRVNALRYGYATVEEAELMATSLRKVSFEVSPGVNKEFFVYRTPHITGTKLTDAIVSGEINRYEAKELYLNWYRKTLQLIKKGDLNALHQDPGARNFIKVKDVSGKDILAPFDFEGDDLAFIGTDSAALKQTEIIIGQIEDYHDLAGLKSSGIDIKSEDLLKILEEEFPGLSTKKLQKIKIVLPPEMIGAEAVGRRVELFYLPETLKGIHDAQGSLKNAYLQHLLLNNSVPDKAIVNLLHMDGTPQTLEVISQATRLSLPDVPRVKAMASKLLWMREMGIKVLPVVKAVAKFADIVGALMLINDIYHVVNDPGMFVNFDSTNLNYNLNLFNFAYAYDNGDIQLAEQLMNLAYLADYQAEGQINAIFNYDSNLNDPNRILVPPEFRHSGGMGIQESGFKNFYTLLLGLRLLEITHKIPISTNGIEALGVDMGSYNDMKKWNEARNIAKQFVREILSKAGIWKETNLVHVDPLLQPIYGKVHTRRIVNNDNTVDVEFAVLDEMTWTLTPKMRITFTPDYKNILQIDGIDGAVRFEIPIAWNSPANIFNERFVIKFGTEEEKRELIEHYLSHSGNIKMSLE